jgi:hypothetical protein
VSYAIEVTKIDDQFLVTPLLADPALPNGIFSAEDLPEQIKKCLALIMWQELGTPRKNCGVQVRRNVFLIDGEALASSSVGAEQLWQETGRGSLTP